MGHFNKVLLTIDNAHIKIEDIKLQNNHIAFGGIEWKGLLHDLSMDTISAIRPFLWNTTVFLFNVFQPIKLQPLYLRIPSNQWHSYLVLLNSASALAGFFASKILQVFSMGRCIRECIFWQVTDLVLTSEYIRDWWGILDSRVLNRPSREAPFLPNHSYCTLVPYKLTTMAQQIGWQTLSKLHIHTQNTQIPLVISHFLTHTT